MKVMKKFSDFMYDQLLESMRLKIKSGELILSKRLKDILSKMDHQIAKDLIAIHRSPEAGPDYKKSFLDVGDVVGEMSFIMVSKVPELLDDEEVFTKYVHNPDSLQIGDDVQNDADISGGYTGGYFETGPLKKPSQDDSDYDSTDYTFSDETYFPDLHDVQFTRKNHPVWSKNRTNQKADRLINDLFPNKYPLNYLRGERPDVPDDRQSFLDMYIATVEENSKHIYKCEGEKIPYWYNCDNYKTQSGTLGGSCMSDPSRASQYLKLYAENPEKVSMLILFPEGEIDKIIGRAILWKIDKIDEVDVTGDIYYMDRIYTVNSSDEELFINYAKRNGYYYKSTQQYGDYPIVTSSGEKENIRISVFLKPLDYGLYPYVDTLSYYCPEDGEVTNKRTSNKNYGTMTSTGGTISF